MNARSGPDRRQFHVLDLLRGIAALAVAGLHLNHNMAHLLPSSHLAVDLFFVLSGFVIAHSYGQRFAEGLGLADFMTTRIVRLYPLYILGSVIGIILASAKLAGTDSDAFYAFVASIGFAILFLPATPSLSFNHAHLYPFNFPAWSLIWELVINIVYAAVSRWLSARVLVAVLIAGATMLICAAWTFHSLDGGSKFPEFALGPMRVVYSFFAGVAVYRIWKRGSLSLVQLPWWAVSALLIAIFACRPTSGGLYDAAVTLVAFPLIVLAATEEPDDEVVRLCHVMGVMSYPLYALQGPLSKIGSGAHKVLGSYDAMFGLPLEVAFLSMFVGLALAADRKFDRPARKWLQSKVPAVRHFRRSLYMADA